MTLGAARLVVIIAILSSFNISAETVFVRDTLYVPLRAAPTEDARLVRSSLKSGTPLTVLAIDSESGFSRVEYREANGHRIEGYIPSQYLDDQPTARMQLKDAQAQGAQLRAKNDELNDRRVADQASIDALTESFDAANQQIFELSTELTKAQSETVRVTDLASDAIALSEALKSLKEANLRLENELATTDEKIAILSETRDQQWFLLGSVVVLSGALVGFWISRRVYHRRFSGGWS